LSLYEEIKTNTVKDFWEVSERNENSAWCSPHIREQLPILFSWFPWYSTGFHANFMTSEFWDSKEGKKLRVQQELNDFETVVENDFFDDSDISANESDIDESKSDDDDDSDGNTIVGKGRGKKSSQLEQKRINNSVSNESEKLKEAGKSKLNEKGDDSKPPALGKRNTHRSTSTSTETYKERFFSTLRQPKLEKIKPVKEKDLAQHAKRKYTKKDSERTTELLGLDGKKEENCKEESPKPISSKHILPHGYSSRVVLPPIEKTKAEMELKKRVFFVLDFNLYFIFKETKRK
jgi:hypothetical protein